MISIKITRQGATLPNYYIGDLAGMRKLKENHIVDPFLVVGDEFYIDSPPADTQALDQEGTIGDSYIWAGTHWTKTP